MSNGLAKAGLALPELGIAAKAPTTSGLTVADVARRYRVGCDKVRMWIRRGELVAINTAAALCGRPRWVVPADSLEAFEQRRRASRPVAEVTTRRRREREMVDYFQ